MNRITRRVLGRTISVWTFVLTALLPLTAAAQERPAQWVLEADLRIGSVDGPAALTRVGTILLDPQRGEVFVTQPQENRIRVFDEQGRLLRSFGRRGSGPGEFEELGTIGWRGDSLYVTDPRLRRITFFSPDGSYLNSLAISSGPEGDRPGIAGPIGLLSGGAVIGQYPPAGAGPPPSPLLGMDRTGRVLRILDSLWLSSVGSVALPIVNGPTANFQRPYSQHSQLAIAPDGSFLVVAHGAPSERGERSLFRVRKLDGSGDVVFARNYGYSPQPLPAAEADRLIGERARGWRQNFGIAPGEAERLAREAMSLPTFYPPIVYVRAMASGDIWLRLREGNSAANQLLVLDPAGEMKAVVHVPSGATIFAAVDGQAWGVELDAHDVPYVVRYRIRDAP